MCSTSAGPNAERSAAKRSSLPKTTGRTSSWHSKNRGARSSRRGRLLGVQFDALFIDDLYFRIGEYAIEKAEELKAIFEKHRIEIYLPSPTNQQFIILSNERAEKLQDTVSVSFWEELNETHTIFRLATSWSTTEEDLKALDDALGAL